MAVSEEGVGFAHPDTFDAAQLIDGAPRRCLLPEAHGIHPAHNAQPGGIVERDAGLPEQLVGARATRLAGGVEPHAGLADPGDQRAHPGGERHGGMADAGARFQHDAGNAADGDLRPGAIGIDGDTGAVLHVQPCMFDKDQRGAVLERDRRRRGKARQALPRPAHPARRISIRPQPKALARPKPMGSCTRKAAGSVISIRPVRSRMPNCGWPLRGPRWPGSTAVP